jgi:hypothetical protein
MFFVGRGVWTDTPVKTTLPRVIPDRSTTAVSSLIDLGDAAADDDGQLRRVDKYGNQIETALGDYRIDPRGDIYERHSPETALPDLGSPAA